MSMRKFNRSMEFELSLEIKDPNFINPPKAAQRNALLNKALKEFTEDLNSLNTVAGKFVPGKESWNLKDKSNIELTDDEIMEDWQIPIMKAMVEEIADPDYSVLEVGFGRGISSQMIQDSGFASHTIIECNDSVIERYEAWRSDHPDRKIELKAGLWQDVIDEMGLFDAIFFHTYVLNEDEYMKYVHRSVTFAEHFFPYAAEHLTENGRFTYLTLEIDSLSRAHQRLLLKYFSSFKTRVIQLNLPDDVADTWWADTMAVVVAYK